MKACSILSLALLLPHKLRPGLGCAGGFEDGGQWRRLREVLPDQWYELAPHFGSFVAAPRRIEPDASLWAFVLHGVSLSQCRPADACALPCPWQPVSSWLKSSLVELMGDNLLETPSRIILVSVFLKKKRIHQHKYKKDLNRWPIKQFSNYWLFSLYVKC